MKALGDDLEDLVILDIIPAKVLLWLNLYEACLTKMKKGISRRKCICTIAEENNISSRTLYKIITFMETG